MNWVYRAIGNYWRGDTDDESVMAIVETGIASVVMDNYVMITVRLSSCDLDETRDAIDEAFR